MDGPFLDCKFVASPAFVDIHRRHVAMRFLCLLVCACYAHVPTPTFRLASLVLAQTRGRRRIAVESPQKNSFDFTNGSPNLVTSKQPNLQSSRLSPPPPSPETPQQDTDRTIDSTLKVFRQSDVAAATSAGAGPLAVATAAAKNAGFDVDGGRGRRQAGGAGGAVADGGGVVGGRAVGALRAQDDEARTIVLERCGALVRSYGAKKQVVAVDNLLASMVKAGVQMNARFLNNALVRIFYRIYVLPSSTFLEVCAYPCTWLLFVGRCRNFASSSFGATRGTYL